ncbi:hypothetical protein GWI33_012331 [Rhynchophorus ferrugineus]|uniref:N-acetyltransferase domain-containing protein n=1 Tax=Rhynchophorus ferrugineus TaxID=354439 RepID=A0A834MJS4_RHYFE|nr:hypothetical protein GWI33_012331 [Rhynchophorus ferrugineus]
METIMRTIEYVSLTKDRLDESILVLREAFFKHENVCIATGLSQNPQAIAECDNLIINVSKHGVSVIAIEKQTNKIVGVALNKIQHKSTSSNEFYEDSIKPAKYPETAGILDFLIEMENSLDPFQPYEANCLLELLFLGVHPNYGKRGIGLKLAEISIELAGLLFKGDNVKTPIEDKQLSLEPRPQIVTSVLTSFKTQRICRRLQFDIVKVIMCRDIFYNGQSYASLLGDADLKFTLECKKLN